LLADPTVFAADLAGERLAVQTSDFAAFTRALPRIARDLGIRLLEVGPTDDSLESVFAYLVRR
jgi:ABC-2 type transport system ATP-binding protein